MKFNHVQAYGSAGGTSTALDVTAHIIGTGAKEVEEVRRLVLAAPKLLAIALECLEAEERRRKELTDKSPAARYADERITRIKAALAEVGAI